MALRIDRVVVWHVQLRLVHPFETSFGLEENKDSVVIRIDAGGLSGFGEAPVHARPSFAADDITTVMHVLRDHMGPSLVGRRIESLADLEADVAGVRGHRFARAGVETALADLLAKHAGVPLHRFYRGHVRGAEREGPVRIAVGVSIGIQPDVEQLVERVQRFVDAGYGRIKIKIKPGWDVEPIAAIRAVLPDVMLFADANAAYSLADLDTLRALDEFDLALIEQPLRHDDLVDHAKLERAIQTPVCLDESLAGLEMSRAALALGAAGAVNIKVPRMGGPLDSIRLSEIARRMGKPVFCGGMLETGIGRAHNMAIATLPGYSLPGDISASDRYYAEDVVTPPATLEDGCLALSEAPGIGVEVVEDRLRAAERATFECR